MSALPVAAPHGSGVGARPAEAVLTGLLVAGALLAVGPRPALLAFVWLAVVTPRLVATDIAEHRLPDRLVLPGWPIALTAAVAEAAVGGTPVGTAVGIAAAYGLLLLVLNAAGGMGLGDVKLAPVLGLAATAASPAAGVAAPLAAFLVGGGLATAVLVTEGRGARIAFGPAMLLGTWAAVLLT